MRVFLIACLTAAAIGLVAALALNTIQTPAEKSFSTEAVRL